MDNTLYCQNNCLKSLDLPVGLETLYCQNNLLKSLILPSGLKRIDYSNNPITLQPVLPESLTSLVVNDLENLPDLPWSINTFKEQKIYQYNQKQGALGMKITKFLPNKRKWDEINEHYLQLQYKIGGEKYNDAKSKL